MSKIISLEEQYAKEQARLMVEALSEEDINKFSNLIGRMDQIIQGKDLPHLKDVIDNAREAVAEMQRDPSGFINFVPGQWKKTKAVSNLVALQTVLTKLFRQIPKIAKLVSGKIRKEGREKRINIVTEGVTLSSLAQALSKELGQTVSPRELHSKAKEMGLEIPGTITKQVDNDVVQQLVASYEGGDEGAEPTEEPPSVASNDAEDAANTPEMTRVDTLIGTLDDKEIDRFRDYIQQAASSDTGFIKALAFGKQPFGLEPETVADEMLNLSAEEFLDLSSRAQAAKLQVPIDQGVAQELAKDAQQAQQTGKEAGGKGVTRRGKGGSRTVSKEKLGNALKRRGLNRRSVDDVLKAIPAGTTIEA